MKTRAIKHLRLLGIAVALTVGWEVRAQVGGEVVPNTVGNTNSFEPFSLPTPDLTQRYQQVYRANSFGAATIAVGGFWLDQITFRVAASNYLAFYGTVTGELQVNLSITQKAPGGLSPVFADNVGTDDTVVFGRAWLRFPLDATPPPGPGAWSFVIPFSPPFFYDPAKGNLLVDVRIFQETNSPTYFGPLPLDAWVSTNSPVSSLWANSVDAASGTLSTVGLVTLFEGQLVPKLGFRRDTNGLTLSWTAQYDYHLQEKLALEAQSAWQSVTNGIVTSNFVNTFTIPFDSMGASSYFRLLYPPP